MRRTLLLLVIGVIASGLGVGHAAPLAACPGSTGLTPSIPPSMGGSCQSAFSLVSLTSVTLQLTAGPGFTGTLRGSVVPANNGAGGGFALDSTFIGGVLVSGGSTRTYSVGPGSWRLLIVTKGVVCNPAQIVPQLPGCTSDAGFSFGSFSGTVTTSAGGAAEPA